MTTKIDIWNLALSALGTSRFIGDEAEPSKEAQLAGRHYEFARQATLKEFGWGFAMASRALTPSAEAAPGGFDRAYAYPVDCLRLHAVEDEEGCPYPYRVRAGVSETLIVTDVAEAVGRFTLDLDDTSRFTPDFIDCVALSLAARLAMPLSINDARAQRVQQNYNQALHRAIAHELNEARPDTAVPESVKARF